MLDGIRTLELIPSPVLDAIPEHVSLRHIMAADRDDLAALYFVSYPPDIGAADLQDAIAEIDMTFAGDFGELRLDASQIAFVSDEPAGAILVTAASIWDADLPGPFVIDLFVDPGFRGRGVGGALMTAAIAACQRRSDRTISLRVGEGTSAAANALYTRLGFSPTL
ncbi:GNAT family N-acetyltransferase [Microbacterium gorillae]|uniref:GNAT family N-acetyltransferase n=1 Tax=Microbacterium gorillae TaxID=1231063 RepID=UPI003D98335C